MQIYMGSPILPCQTLQSTGFDSILKTEKGRKLQDGKDTRSETRYSTKELLE